MNKKLSVFLFCFACCLTFTLGLSACDNGNGGEDEKDPSHTHTYSTEWESDEVYHWHASACGHANEIADKAEHSFSNNICSVCGHKIIVEGFIYELSLDETFYIVTGNSDRNAETIVVPSEYNGLPVKEIGENAFADYSALTNVILPESVAVVANNAFGNCNAIEKATIPASAISAIPKTNLKSVVITSGEIKDFAFDGCVALTKLTIYDNVTAIENGAFNGCNRIETATIPANAISAVPKTNLKSVTITSGEIKEFAFKGFSSLTSVTILDKVTVIDNNAFNGCNTIETATIPANAISAIPKTNLKNVTITSGKIAEQAFYEYNALTNVTILDEVTIGDYAFEDCSALTKITISDNVRNIGAGIFYGCKSLNYNQYDNAYYIGNDNNPYLILVKTTDKSITNCIINENTKFILGGYRETLREGNGFAGCDALSSITIPEGLIGIGDLAFSCCYNLTDISIPDNLLYVGETAFLSCDKLNYNRYDNGYYLGSKNNPYLIFIKATDTSITSCSINDKTKFIYGAAVSPWGYEIAFYNCSSLTNIIIPDSVIGIGGYSFYGCNSLTSINIPDGVTSIEDFAIYRERDLLKNQENIVKTLQMIV
ncbi:MAG: hypothetical protein DBX59_09220 [Bacillota bacterium]|nr:MAG: hypothetical protein DBX59_09220 [Bacillota bacterium]